MPRQIGTVRQIICISMHPFWVKELDKQRGVLTRSEYLRGLLRAEMGKIEGASEQPTPSKTHELNQSSATEIVQNVKHPTEI
ncbi:MAG: hypothetical protein M1387_07135 [Thaumarchaeota archaeon]|nr:hypothetical protein [Nitrososphaerota archaeon]